MRLLFSFLILTCLFSCTHYKAVSFEQLEKSQLIGKWGISLDPYFLDFDCNGKVSFILPSKVLYGDQKGSDFLVTELKDDTIVLGPVLRIPLKVDEWPHDEYGRTLMTINGRIWSKTETYHCE